MSIVRLSRGATCSTILGQHQQTKAVLFTGVELCLHTFNVLPSPVELYSTFDKPLSILPTNSIIAHTHYTCSIASIHATFTPKNLETEIYSQNTERSYYG